MSCLLAGALTLSLAGPGFTLEWTHSVERVAWRETWAVDGPLLRLVEAAVQGSGAGMEPGDGARLRDGWWVWRPALPPVPEVVLAASGATDSGWRLCDRAGACHELGGAAGQPVVLRPCPPG